MSIFQDGAFLRLVGGLAIIGAAVSLIGSLIAGVGVMLLLLRLFLFSFLMALLGAGIYFVFQSLVPTVNNSLRGEDELSSGDELGDEGEDFSVGEDVPLGNGESFSEPPSDYGDLDGMDMSAQRTKNQKAARRNREAKEGEIMVEGVNIKNDPAVMADAVRDMLDRDDD